jgi:zinc protease
MHTREHSRFKRPASLLVLAVLLTICVTAAPADAQKHWSDLTYPPLRDIQVPKVDQIELANGLKLYLLEDHSLPKVEGLALIRTGDRFEPADKVGLASMVGQVIRTGGTTTHPGEEIDRMLENAGAVVETGIGTSSASASIFALKEDLPMALEILADLLRNPAFPEDKIELAKVQERAAISRRNDDVTSIASREFIQLVFGKHNPYGRTTEYATIDAITRDDLLAFHAKYFHPNETALGLWGDFDSSEVTSLVEKHFGAWERKKVDFPPLPEVSANWEASINFIPKDDVNQTNLRIGHLGGRRDDPDYFALQLMSEILGGGFSSRLFQRVRTELGLAYAASASWGAGWDRPGSFFIFCNTKSETTLQATEEILKEVRRITEEPVSDDELRVAKEGILNSFVFNFDTTGKIVRRLMTYDYYGYPKDYLQKYKANIEKVTPEDIWKAAKKHVKPDKLIVLAVGRAEDFDKPLSTLGEVNTIDISIPPPKSQ